MADPAVFVGTTPNAWEQVPFITAGVWRWQNTGGNACRAVLTDGAAPTTDNAGEVLAPGQFTPDPVTVDAAETLWVKGVDAQIFARNVA